MAAIDVSVVIACYNEERILAASVEELLAVLRATRLSFELIFVDDASQDQTLRAIEACVARHPDVPMRVIRHAANTGRGRTVADGFRAARGRIVGYLDIDLEVHARYVPSMVDAIDREGYDAATAWRIYKLRWFVLLRAVCGAAYRGLVRAVLRLPCKDTEAGFKFFRREALLPLLEQVRDPGWFWDTELMARSCMHGLRMKEVPCLFIRRADKRSTVRVVRDSARYLAALWRFRRGWRRCPAQTGLLYRSPRLYHWAMRLLYRGGERRRLEAVARLIPDGASVLDVCAGDGSLYTRTLRGRAEYLGLDCNPRLVQEGICRGARMRLADVTREALPEADVVVMQASLYQFIPNEAVMLRRLLGAARRRVIVAEPIRNWATDTRAWRRALSRWWTNPGSGPATERFSRSGLEALLRRHGAAEVRHTLDGRELIAVLDVAPETADSTRAPVEAIELAGARPA